MLKIDKLSYWEKKTFLESIDFLIIGAGIVGYSTVLHLKKKYPTAKIVLIERGLLPAGASSKNAGFACFGSATELIDDINNYGEDLVWETVALRWQGLKHLRKIIGDDNLKLEINGSWDLITDKDDDLFLSTKSQLPYLNDKILKITEQKDVFSIDDSVCNKFGFKNIDTSIYNKLEGQIDTAAMNHHFHKLAIENGIHVLFGIEATDVVEEGTSFIRTTIGEIYAKKIIICTNGFSSTLLDSEKVKPARAQVLITKPIDNLPFAGTFHYDKGYYYFRNIDGRVLLGGGRNLDFEGETTSKLETTQMIQHKLEELLREIILPGIDFEIDYSWAGIMGVGEGKKPIIKQISKSIYCGIKMGGMGVAIGSLVGKEISDLINDF